MKIFKEKVFQIVKKIPPGKFLTYKEIAEKTGSLKAARAVGQILAKNSNPKIFCHRVIRNDNSIGGYHGKESLSWLKIAKLLREGAIGVIPTDTLYGICASAYIRRSIEEVYKLRKRKTNKPMIILISSIDDLRRFKIKLSNKQKEILTKLWPGKTSVILNCPYQGFKYLHRGMKTLAFRLPEKKFIAKILKISGPLVAPSANWEGFEPAKNIAEAKKYFGNKIFYLNKGNLISKPSTLIDLARDLPKVIRKGSDFAKVKSLLYCGNLDF